MTGRRNGLQRLAQRGGAVSAALGITVTLFVAAALMRAALLDGARRLTGDLGALLMSSCQAAVALDDAGLVQETLEDLAPGLPDLVFVRIRTSAGRVVGSWGPEADDASVLRGSTSVVGSDGKVVIGRVDIGISTRPADEALKRMWAYLGLIGVVSIGFSTGASVLVGGAMAEKSRLEGEVAVAERVQTAVLPRELRLPGFEVAARMLPASEVGGDYYDVIPLPDGGFVCIGDVVGHGLPAGLVMLMMQSGLATALRGRPTPTATDAVQILNEVLYDNGARMGVARHASLSVLRCTSDGGVDSAGGHLDPIVLRAGGSLETIDSPGPFVGLEPDLERDAIGSTRFHLGPGDLMLLYTDGISEARNSEGEMFGPERLRSLLATRRDRAPAELVADVFAAVATWSAKQDDDLTVLVVRRKLA